MKLSVSPTITNGQVTTILASNKIDLQITGADAAWTNDMKAFWDNNVPAYFQQPPNKLPILASNFPTSLKNCFSNGFALKQWSTPLDLPSGQMTFDIRFVAQGPVQVVVFAGEARPLGGPLQDYRKASCDADALKAKYNLGTNESLISGYGVTIYYLPEDVANYFASTHSPTTQQTTDGLKISEKELSQQLFMIGARACGILIKHGLRMGGPPIARKLLQGFKTSLQAPYYGGEKAITVGLYRDYPPVTSVVLSRPLFPRKMAFDTSTPAEPTANAEYNRHNATVLAEIQHDYLDSGTNAQGELPRDRLVVSPYRPLVNSMLPIDQAVLGSDERLESVGQPSVDSKTGLVTEEVQPKSMGGLATVGLSYDTTKSLTSSVDLELGALISADQKLNLGFEAGGSFLGGHLDQNTVLWHGDDHTHAVCFYTNIDDSNQEDYRLGNRNLAKFRASVIGGDTGFSWLYDSQTPLDQWRAADQLEKGWKEVRVVTEVKLLTGVTSFQHSDSPGALGVSDGFDLAPGVASNTTLTWNLSDYTSPGGMGRLESGFNVRIQHGLSVGGNDFSYDKATGLFSNTLYLGGETKDDYFVQLAVSGGAMDSSAPVFEFFRAGADANSWGLRDGEFASRDEVTVALEGGITILHLFQKAGLEIDPKSQEAQQMKAMYLFAGVSNSSLFDQFANGQLYQGNLNIQDLTIGMKIPVPIGTLPPATASFGYAYSPQSTLENTGQFYSSYTMSF